MPLFDFHCGRCEFDFEILVSANLIKKAQAKGLTEQEMQVECPQCRKNDQTQRLISKFAVGGQGDLRESTYFHGCHDSFTGTEGHDHSHEHDPSKSATKKKTGTDD